MDQERSVEVVAQASVDRPFVDVAVVGGGAAGLATAIFAARQGPGSDVVVLDGAKKLGAKILVSGGGRCNVTNAVVTPADFRGGRPHLIRRVLSALSVVESAAFFNEIGVELHEEAHGKLFPDSNSARTVLSALLAEAARRGVRILTGHRVTDVKPCGDGFGVFGLPGEKGSGALGGTTGAGSHTDHQICGKAPDRFSPIRARCVVLATGGKSLPKTGSDGFGYELARQLGHSLVSPTPALAPLVLDGDFHAGLSGVSQEIGLCVRVAGAQPVRLQGSMLWTHFGASGPVMMDASGLWHRAQLEGRKVSFTANFLPDDDFQSAEVRLIELASRGPKTALHTALATLMPARVADAVLGRLGIAPRVPMAHLPREVRRKLIHALVDWPLPVTDSRGYNYAEVTAGGVPLDEIDPATMESRKCPGLYLVGEILDVDGRIGGFNFQWAWSSGYVAGRALARAKV